MEPVQRRVRQPKSQEEKKAQQDHYNAANPMGNRFCFTWFNYGKDDTDFLVTLGKDKIDFLIFGYEVCPETGRKHLQGYVETANGKVMRKFAVIKMLDRKCAAKNCTDSSLSMKECNGSKAQNIKYCAKCPTKDPSVPEKDQVFLIEHRERGKGCNGNAEFLAIMEDAKKGKSLTDIVVEYPEVAIKHFNGLKAVAEITQEKVEKDELLEEYPSNVRMFGWQRDLVNLIAKPAPGRKILWFWSKEGGMGKSALATWMWIHMGAALFTNAKSADLAKAWKKEKIIVIDLTFSSEDHTNYAAMEAFKNGIVFSPKYESATKGRSRPWVVVFANRPPDVGGQTLKADRLKETVYFLEPRCNVLEEDPSGELVPWPDREYPDMVYQAIRAGKTTLEECTEWHRQDKILKAERADGLAGSKGMSHNRFRNQLDGFPDFIPPTGPYLPQGEVVPTFACVFDANVAGAKTDRR